MESLAQKKSLNFELHIKETIPHTIITDSQLLAQTAFALTHQKAEFFKEGMDGYLSKPISMTALKNELKALT